MEQVDYLIIGGGIAGTTAAEEIRSRDKTGSITILTDESERLYSRVRLPHFLRGENSLESVYLRTVDTYNHNNINLLTQERAVKVNTEEKIVTTDKDHSFSYRKLLLSSGGAVNKLSVPGSNLPEISYLRTISDAQKIKDLMLQSKEAVAIGGGFIAVELAQTFVKNNLRTTALVQEHSYWEQTIGSSSGKLIEQVLSSNGVRVLTASKVNEFIGEKKLEGVRLENSETINCELAGVGIGIHFSTDYLEGSDLVIKNGVVTNEYLETSVKDVWAAGDIAEFFDPVLQKYHLLGNWANASSQGRIAGLNMSGERTVFETTSMYSINIFDTNLCLLGDAVKDEKTEVIERGKVEDKKLARLLIRDDYLVGVSLINLPLERALYSNLIKTRTKITAVKNKLQDLSFDLSTV